MDDHCRHAGHEPSACQGRAAPRPKIDDYLSRIGPSEQAGACPASGPIPFGAAGGPIGTAHPAIAMLTDRQKRWSVICQAREDTDVDGKTAISVGHHGDLEGDRAAAYVIVGSGSGVNIDGWLGTDPTGRYLAVRQGLCLALVDVERHTATYLPGADLRAGHAILGPPRAAAFSPDGSRMLYVRTAKVVVRELASGAKAMIDPGAGLLFSARFSPDSRTVVLGVVTEDTNGDGRTELPRPRTTLPGSMCLGQAMSFSVLGFDGDEPVERSASIQGGLAVDTTAPGVEPKQEEKQRPPPLPKLVNARGEDPAKSPAAGPFHWK